MFGKKSKNNNFFISRMTGHIKYAMDNEPYAEEIKPMLKAFLEKCMSAEANWEDDDIVCVHVQNITLVAHNLADNTRTYEKISDEDVQVFQKIFYELNELLEEALNLTSQHKGYLIEKIMCIDRIAYNNHANIYSSRRQNESWRESMVFKNYENLWKMIHRVNTKWDELCSRGFSIRVVNDFYNSLNKEMSEEEKINTFMLLLDGKMKFIPVYRHEYTPLGFKIVDNDFDDEIIYASDTKYNKSYRMKQVEEETTSE